MDSRSESHTDERVDIDEMCNKEEFYRRGEEYLRKVLRSKEKVKYETGKRIIEGVRRKYKERCLAILSYLDVDYNFLEIKNENSKEKMKELFKPLSDIKIAGWYIFKDIAESIGNINSENEGLFEIDFKYENEKLKKEIERIREENERQHMDVVRFIEKKYNLIEGENEEKSRVGESNIIIDKYCDEERERKECLRILDNIEKGSIKIEDREGYCSGENYRRDKNNDPILKAIKKAIKTNDCRSVSFLSKGCSLFSSVSIKSGNKYYSLFGYSCKVNSIDCAVYLLKNGGGIEQRFEYGGTPLSHSIRARNENIARFLINIGAKNSDGELMLHEAAWSNSYEIAKFFIDRGLNIEEKDKYGRTPLNRAALSNSIEVAELLIEKGANIDEKDREGRTSLHCAALNNSIEVGKLLIENGANIDEKDGEGRTSLNRASSNNNIAFTELLIEKGANIDEKDKEGRTPLNRASSNNNFAVAKLLIGKGAKIDEKDREGRTHLHCAALNNSIEVSKLLIEKGANINERTNNGKTPLHIAAFNGSIEVAKLLIEKGAKIDVKDNEGRTPMHCAAWSNSIAVAKLLIEKGAKILQT